MKLKWQRRLDLFRTVEVSVDAAKTEICRIRGMTNWHRLAPGAKIEIQALRVRMLGVAASIAKILEEE